MQNGRNDYHYQQQYEGQRGMMGYNQQQPQYYGMEDNMRPVMDPRKRDPLDFEDFQSYQGKREDGEGVESSEEGGEESSSGEEEESGEDQDSQDREEAEIVRDTLPAQKMRELGTKNTQRVKKVYREQEYDVRESQQNYNEVAQVKDEMDYLTKRLSKVFSNLEGNEPYFTKNSRPRSRRGSTTSSVRSNAHSMMTNLKDESNNPPQNERRMSNLSYDPSNYSHSSHKRLQNFDNFKEQYFKRSKIPMRVDRNEVSSRFQRRQSSYFPK